MTRLRRLLAELRDAIVQAAFSLVSHKLRALLTISGIAIGIMTVILIFMVQSGMSASFARQLSTLGPNTLFVHKWKWGVSGSDWWKYKNRPHVTILDLRALQQNTTLPVAIAPLVSTLATVSHAGKDVKGVDVRGTTDGYLAPNLAGLQKGFTQLAPEGESAIHQRDANGNYLRQYLVVDPACDQLNQTYNQQCGNGSPNPEREPSSNSSSSSSPPSDTSSSPSPSPSPSSMPTPTCDPLLQLLGKC